MNSTGIVRRIDDLGRIVIPKEIRRRLRIREGDPLELYTENGAVIFKKYSPIADYKGIISSKIDTLRKELKLTTKILVIDKDSVITVSGFNNNIIGKSHDYGDKICKCFTIDTNFDCVIGGNSVGACQRFVPIKSNGDVVGALLVFETRILNDFENKLIDFTAKLIGREIENEI